MILEKFKVFSKEILRRTGWQLIRSYALDSLRARAVSVQDLRFLMAVGEHCDLEDILPWIEHSKAQLRQDLLVLVLTEFRRQGFFVEFGSTDGVELSNSFLLEANFGWRGILAEPARGWHKNLRNNRNCAIDTRCVWSTTGERLHFFEEKEKQISTLAAFQKSDLHANLRIQENSYEVETVSLLDLLSDYGAPEVIDYLSVDTEGSEYEILSAFDFSRYKFRVITVEHNHTSSRERINALLSSNGYQRIFSGLSDFDDWYFNRALAHGKGFAAD